MNIQAELFTSASSTPQQVTLSFDTAVIEAGSLERVALHLRVSDVETYIREGDDLILVLANGERIVLADFFREDSDGRPILTLVADSGDTFVEVGFAGDAPGVLEVVFSDDSTDIGIAPLPLPLLLAGLAAGASGIGAVVDSNRDDRDGHGGNGGGNGGGGNGGDDDGKIGSLPKPTVNPSNGKELTGTAEPGKIVEVDVNGDGKSDYTTIVDEDGNWSIDFEPDLPDGGEVTIIITDPEGNTSDPVIRTVDAIAPAAPRVDATDGKVITGTSEPGARIEIDLDGDGRPDFTTTANEKGQWSYDPQPDLADGTDVVVRAVDAAGNVSAPTTVQVDTSIVRPPVVDPSNGKQVSGTGEPGTTIEIDTDGDGNPEQTTTVGTDGKWSVNLQPDAADGEKIEIVAVKDGKESEPVIVEIDAVAPQTPHVEPTDGKIIEGTGEPGSRIEVDTDGDGNSDYTTIVDEGGHWTVDPEPNLPVGQPVTIIAVDEAGNESQPITVMPEKVPAPQIDPTNGSRISGTSVPGALIEIDINDDGTAEYTATASANGNWSVTPDSKLPDGTKVAATASKGGVTSGEALEIVDGSVPDAPRIDTTSGRLISGTAEPLARVDIDTDGDGKADYTARADEDGHWSVDPNPNLTDGTTIVATATDAAGNISAPATVTVDTSSVPAPIVEPTNGKYIEGTAQPGDVVMVDVDGDGRPEYSDTADAHGNWRVNPQPDLDDKDEVTIWSENGNTKSGEVTVVVDAATPFAPQIDATDGTVISGTAEAGVIVKVDVNGDGIADYTATADENGDWSIDPQPDVVSGRQVSATATDAAGNVSDPAFVVVDSGSGSGVPAPHIDPTAGRVITGTAAFGTTVELDLGDGTKVTVQVEDGRWSYDPQPDLGNGTEVTAVAVDARGDRSAPDTEIVDTTVPPAPSITEISQDSGTAGDGVTNDNTLVFSGKARPNAEVEVFIDNQSIGKTKADANGGWSFDHADTPLADGAYVVTARQTNPQGTESPVSAAFNVQVDTNGGGVNPGATPAPTVTGISDDRGSSTDDGATDDATLVFRGEGEAGATVEVFLDGSSIGTAVVDANGQWSYDHSGTPLANGNHEVYARQTDAAGNAQSAPSSTFYILVAGGTAAAVAFAEAQDGSAPLLATTLATGDAPAITGISDDTGTAGDRMTSDNTLVITGTANPGATVRIYDGINVIGTAQADANGLDLRLYRHEALRRHPYVAGAGDRRRRQRHFGVHRPAVQRGDRDHAAGQAGGERHLRRHRRFANRRRDQRQHAGHPRQGHGRP